MMIVRPYKKISWWDFVEYFSDEKLGTNTALWFDMLDECKMRIFENVSEGGNFKIKKFLDQKHLYYLSVKNEIDKESHNNLDILFEELR